METDTFLARWPIVDDALTYQELCRTAADDLPLLVAQAHCRLVGRGAFSIAFSDEVPGSGHITEMVLLYKAPAVPLPARSYWSSNVSA